MEKTRDLGAMQDRLTALRFPIEEALAQNRAE
jgi:hypothetical protein